MSDDPSLSPTSSNYVIWGIGKSWPEQHYTQGFTQVYWNTGECKVVSESNLLISLFIFVVPLVIIITAPLKCTEIGKYIRRKRLIHSMDINLGSGIIILLYLLVVLVLTGLRINASLGAGNDNNHSVLLGTGHFVLMNLWLSMLPNSKSPLWMFLVGSPFERAIKYHRALAGFSLWIAAVHFILASYVTPEQLYSTAKQGDVIPLYGVLGFFCLLAMALSAVPWITKQNYRIFLLVHYLHIPLIIFLCLHVDIAVYGFIPGIILQGK